ncbi:MAG: helix-turn-helix domain-containing protein [Bacteroidales bacterium]|nr:helix-turn-helix domain-containing protein [Bacteroidales bacterium]
MEVLELLQKQDERLSNIENLLSFQKIVLNINEVSKLTGLSKSTIYKMTCSGMIPHYKKAKHLYFDRIEIENWLKSDRIKTSDEIDREASTYVTLKKGG